MRLRDAHGQEVHLPCPVASQALRERSLFWANRLCFGSFGDVARLLEQMTGVAVVSEDGVWRWVQEQARVLDAAQRQMIAEETDQPEPVCVAPDDLYAPESAEFVVMTDGIGVKAQKPTRHKAGPSAQPQPVKTQPQPAKVEKRHDTDVLLLPHPNGAEQVLCEGVSGDWTLVEAARSFLRRQWGGAVLPVVALTDGAKTIRSDLRALFGDGVSVVLDWYHLEKRVYEHHSMAAHSSQEREAWQGQMLALLWRGQVAAAQEFLCGLRVRNAKARAELMGYLDKHK